jgi:hypothetical protein
VLVHWNPRISGAVGAKIDSSDYAEITLPYRSGH